MIFVGITDFNDQRYIAEVKPQSPFAGETEAAAALREVAMMVQNQDPIDCTIVHKNNKADITVVFLGPVRIDVARSKEEA